LTPITAFDGWWVKREDMAAFTSLEYPSGSKVRQYAVMAKASPGLPMVVGCSANSAQQIYVAAAARQNNVPAVVCVPKRRVRSEATCYAADMGAKIVELSPGYISQLRQAARSLPEASGGAVKWNPRSALADATEQAANLPAEADRVVIATGSGLTAAGVLAGLSTRRKPPTVLAIAVSGLADHDAIVNEARSLTQAPLPPFELVRHPLPYDKWLVQALPDGTPLDPFYAAKAFGSVRAGDVLWTPGLRPIRAMPAPCREAFKGWLGFGPGGGGGGG